MKASNARGSSPPVSSSPVSRRVRSAVFRQGITLLEVLISMGVLAVGLLGLASLLPVARFFMQDGSKYDRSSTLGQQALHYLEARSEFINPDEWYAPAGNGKFLQVCPPETTISGVTYSGSYNYNWPTNSPIATIPAAPFILDPLACAYPSNLTQNGNGGAASGTGQLNTAGSYSATFFPPSAYSLDGAGNPGSPAFTRITFPRTDGIALGGGSGFAAPMSFAMAERIFTSRDDLLFELPDDPAVRPYVVQPLNATTPYATSQGDYSWFAVIDNMEKPWDPGANGGWGAASSPPNIATDDDNGDGVLNDIAEAGWPGSDDIALWKSSGGELWHVWTVVVYKRNLQLIPPSAADTPPERMCYCDFLNAPTSSPSAQVMANAGLGGGDCVLYVPSSMAPSEEWLNVKPNQWIMLSGWPNLNSDPFATAVRGQLGIMQWFRLSQVGEIEAIYDTTGALTGWQRAVTLTGPDWNPYKFVDAIGAPAGNQSCYATIVDGVVGVYEGTIEQGQN